MEASFGKRDPLALAMTMVQLHQSAQRSVREGRFREACEELSQLVQGEVDAPWVADAGRLREWGELLNDCQDRHRLNPRGEWPAIEYEVQGGDNLIAIRKKVLEGRPELLLCTGLIEQTNDLSGFLQPGMRLRIPTARPNVVVDLGARVVLYRHGKEVVRVWIVRDRARGPRDPGGAVRRGREAEEPGVDAGRRTPAALRTPRQPPRNALDRVVSGGCGHELRLPRHERPHGGRRAREPGVRAHAQRARRGALRPAAARRRDPRPGMSLGGP